MLDTPIGQEILRMGVKEGIAKGAQRILLKQIAARFGRVPDDMRRKITAIKDIKELDHIVVIFLKSRSLAELKKRL